VKNLALLAAAFALALPAWAQDAKPPAQPAVPEAPKAEAPKAEAPKAKPMGVKKANPRRQEDARHCLEKASNTEVIKCAEAYL
jgi:hypothetical protein